MTCITKVSRTPRCLFKTSIRLTFLPTGEGKFEDNNASHDPSGAATPTSNAEGPPAKKKKGGLSKKAKTVKQRLAVIDGEVG